MTADSSDPADPGPDAAPQQLLELRLGDEPGAWQAAGFEVGADGRFLLGSTVVRCTGSGRGFDGWAFAGLGSGSDSLDGLGVFAAAPPKGVDRAAAHPNGIRSIDHVVVRTGDCERTIAAFVGAGFEVRGGRSTTSYGSPMRQTFFWAGDVILELVGPDAGEATSGEPTTVFGLALVADDLDATAAVLGELLGTPKEAVQAGRRIAGLRNKAAGISLPIAVMSPHVRD